MDKSNQVIDLFIVGGGINGVGIARDAAGRGLNVALCEQGDLGSATSWTSSKLIHGGLRYLEHYEFRLVRESLAEREILLRAAPHLIRPLRFVLPHVPTLRPAWMLRAGLFLYDHLSRRVTLPGSEALNLRQSPFGAGLRPEFRKGFAYSDCQVDDARLVIANARSATALGAKVLVGTACIGAEVLDGLWQVHLKSQESGAANVIRARTLINVAGPWASRVAASIKGVKPPQVTRLIKGSHIVVPRVHEGQHAYLLQNDDRRQVFVIPFEDDYSLIGTTEVELHGDPGSVSISADEIDYLCRAVNRYLVCPVKPEDVVWSYAGVRPLFGNGEADLSSITRDYELEFDTVDGAAPMVTVYGGKITTYRSLAEHVLTQLKPYFPNMQRAWTTLAYLPGGDFPDGDLDSFVRSLAKDRPKLALSLLTALARRYGTLCTEVLDGATDIEAMGQHFGAGLYAREVEYLVEREWARTAEDVLWRRTKTGLHMSPQQRTNLAEYFSRRPESMKARSI
ncbi:MAG: glycerol-3-phosphate dehydrogenase [Acidiferrobacterales bacterium]